MFSRNAFSQERERHQVFQWLPSHLIVSRGIRLRIRLRIALHSSSNCTAFGFGLHCIRLRIARRSSARAEPSGGPERVGRRDSDSRPAITMGRRAAPGRRPVHGDAIGSGAIGARTTESQVHRELASGLSAPIGFKNGTDGNIKIATDAIQAAGRGHHFLSVHKNGQVAIVETKGNKDCHVILRGGKTPNYDAASVKTACDELSTAKLHPSLMVDLSHANSSKQHERQIEVAKDVANQISNGSKNIFGVMVESHLVGGAQKFTPGKDDPKELSYGQSITDACINWDDSINVLDILAEGVKKRRSK